MGKIDYEFHVAWNTINLISKEYNYMWDKLEKLEILLYQQQNVIAQLLSALITSDNLDCSVEQIDFIYDDIGELSLKYYQKSLENERRLSSINQFSNLSPKERHLEVVEVSQPTFNLKSLEDHVQNRSNRIEPQHKSETNSFEINVIVEQSIKDTQVFTSQDYVHFHEDSKSLISDNDIEKLIQIDRMFDYTTNRFSMDKQAIENETKVTTYQDKETTTSDKDDEPLNNNNSKNELPTKFRKNDHQARLLSQSNDTDNCVLRGILLKEPIESSFVDENINSNLSFELEPNKSTSACNIATSTATNTIEEKPNILERHDPHVEHRPSLVKENSIEENFYDDGKLEVDLFVDTVQTQNKSNSNLIVDKNYFDEADHSASLEPKYSSENLIQLDQERLLQQQQILKTAVQKKQPQNNKNKSFHRRFNSLEEKNILSSITSSVLQGYQNVFRSSNRFKRDSKEHAISDSNASSNANTNLLQSNLKDSIKNIWGGFRDSLHDSMSSKEEEEEQRDSSTNQQLSLPELASTNNIGTTISESSLCNEDNKEIFIDNQIDNQTEKLISPNNYDGDNYIEQVVKQDEKLEKKSFRTQSMQEANTMMDTLKVNSFKDDHQKSKLEKSFSDESAIFLFTPSSRQNSVIQSEQDSEQLSSSNSPSIYFSKENNDQINSGKYNNC